MTNTDPAPRLRYPGIRFERTDAGRGLSKRPRQDRDCVVRAIATAFRSRYDDVYDALAEAGRKCGRSTAKSVWQGKLNRCATRHSFPAVAGEPRLNVVTFSTDHGHKGRWVVQCAGHLIAVCDGVVYDDSEPRYNACVYAAWKVDGRDFR
jgi:hypothetical protein